MSSSSGCFKLLVQVQGLVWMGRKGIQVWVLVRDGVRLGLWAGFGFMFGL